MAKAVQNAVQNSVQKAVQNEMQNWVIIFFQNSRENIKRLKIFIKLKLRKIQSLPKVIEMYYEFLTLRNGSSDFFVPVLFS